MSAPTIEVKNRRAGFEYHLLDAYTCGIVLMGSEIKSIRAGGASIGEAFCASMGEVAKARTQRQPLNFARATRQPWTSQQRNSS